MSDGSSDLLGSIVYELRVKTSTCGDRPVRKANTVLLPDPIGPITLISTSAWYSLDAQPIHSHNDFVLSRRGALLRHRCKLRPSGQDT